MIVATSDSGLRAQGLRFRNGVWRDVGLSLDGASLSIHLSLYLKLP